MSKTYDIDLITTLTQEEREALVTIINDWRDIYCDEIDDRTDLKLGKRRNLTGNQANRIAVEMLKKIKS